MYFTRRALSLTASLALVLSACEISKTTGPEDPEDNGPTLTSIVLSENAIAMAVGESTTLSAEFRDENGSMMFLDPTDSNIQWTSSDESVVSLTDISNDLQQLSAVGEGTATVTVRRFTVTASATATVEPDTRVNLAVANRLLGPVDLEVNGAPAKRIQPGDTARLNWDVLAQLDVAWTLGRPTTNQGNPLGEAIGGRYRTIDDPQGDINLVVDNVVGDNTYFAPVLQNDAAADLLMGVNMETSEEQRCGCYVPAGADSVYMGYYTLLSDSNVRGYRTGSNYTGPYIYWTDLAGGVESLSGELGLRATSAPSPGRSSAPPLALPLPRPFAATIAPHETYPDFPRGQPSSR